MGQVLSGDLGRSLITNRSIVADVAAVLPFTIELTVAALLIGIVVGVPLGVVAARRRDGFADWIARIVSLAGLSFPAFVSGILMLLVFAIHFHWLPVISRGWPLTDPVERLRSLALPALNLGLIMVAYVTRVTRSGMLKAMSEDYVRTARAKGVPARLVVWRHGFRNVLIPIVTVIGLYFGVLIGNSVLTEIVFNRPGLGKLIIGALEKRDYTMLQGLMVIYAFIIVMVNLVTDLAYGLVDPRVKTV
jgi:ABC-type dipeptide/oligopeptide/nickel transport system permease component